MNRPLPFALPLLASLAFAGAAAAQDLIAKAAPQSRPVVIRNAVLHTLDRGTILGGTIWFQDGAIRGVHAADEKPALPAGQEPIVIDGTGKHVFPGLIAACTQLGLQELGMVRQTVDLSEIGDIAPEALALVAVNPDSTALPVTRSNGVLVAGVFPSGGLGPGRASVIQLDGWTNKDLAVLADAGVVVDWPALPADGPQRGMRGRRPGPPTPGQPAPGQPPGQPIGPPAHDDAVAAVKKQRAQIDEAFAKASAWFAQKQVELTLAPDLRAQSLVPATRGEVPVFLLADELEEIESAVAWALGRKLRAVIVGGRDALLCERLKEQKVPVIVTGTLKLPHREDAPYDEAFTLPARLAAAGIPFCIASGEPFYNERNLAWHAACAAAHGLDREQALAAITKDAAAILGVGNRLGTLTAGKDATLFVADGSPLDVPTHIEHAFIRGREIDLRNKQTELAKKYREKYRQVGEGK
jgi:imidazolonepropionase-like amidohydrolase